METREVKGVKFKIDEKWDSVRDNKHLRIELPKKKGFFRNLLAFLKK